MSKQLVSFNPLLLLTPLTLFNKPNPPLSPSSLLSLVFPQVFFMQAGFAMLCAGSVRSKNAKNIMLKNLLDACKCLYPTPSSTRPRSPALLTTLIPANTSSQPSLSSPNNNQTGGGAIGFYVLGWGFAYGGEDSTKQTFCGSSEFAPTDNTGDMYHVWFFEFVFAATASTIVAGSIAERCTMKAYICYSMMLTGFVYPIVAHSIWSKSGFLSIANDNPVLAVIDSAGAGVVHLTGGACALVAAIVLGPRLTRFYDDKGNVLRIPTEMPGHSTSLQMLGTFILW
jgi:Amt family ammonium transporter